MDRLGIGCADSGDDGGERHSERGSALIYILIAIALLALLTVSFMEPSSQQTQSQNTFKVVSELQSQAELIRSAVQECVIAHNRGDKTIDNTAGGSDIGADHRYPIDPNSDHFLTSTTLPAGNREVKNIRCPGNPGDQPGETIAAPGNAVNHAGIFSASSGKFMPPPPALFSEWQWYNGEDGVFFWIGTDKSDAFIGTALDKLEESFADCEADQIDATGGAVALDEAATVTCANGLLCFRVWMVADRTRGAGDPEDGVDDAAAAHFPDEAACDVP